jgi:hypothetical protein
MKTTMKVTLALLALGAWAVVAHAQDNGGPPNGPPPGDGSFNGGPPPQGQDNDGPGPQGQGFRRPPPLPLAMALDTNHDGIIDSNEIANAPAELKTLDKNGDGQLTSDEYLPPRPSWANDSNFHPPVSPLVTALDVNQDGVIDSNEIANASAELKTLDKNGDGQLTRDEYCPPRPGGMGGPPDGGDQSDGGPPGPPPNQ